MKPTNPWQRGLQFFNGCIYLPNSLDGTGAWDKWDTGTGTITHATVGTAFDTQFKRTIWTNDATINRQLGPRKALAGDYQFWLGDKRFCGGFYFSAITRIEAWQNNNGRLFVGLTNSTNAQCTADTLNNNTMGFFHKSTDGANIINFVTRDDSGNEVSAIIADATHSVGALAAGVTLLWEIWHFPNAIDPASVGLTGVTVNCKLSFFDTSNGSDSVAKPLNRVKKLQWNEVGFGAAKGASETKMFAPQVQMSNANDVNVGRFSLGVANIYVAPWSGEMD